MFGRPDTTAPLFDPAAMRWPADRRADCAARLAEYVAAELPCDTAEQGRQAGRALGLAVRLDPQSRPAVLSIARLERGQRPAPPAKPWDPAAFRAALTGHAAACKAAGTPDDLACAAHLYDLLFAAAPDDLRALRELEALRLAGREPQWGAVDPTTGPTGTLAALAPAGPDAPAAPLWSIEVPKLWRAVLSRDGRHAFTAGGDGAVRMIEVATGREVRQFRGHAFSVSNVAVSGDGRRLATLSDDKTVRAWDVASGRELRQFPCKGMAHAGLGISPDGGRVAYAEWDGVRVFDVDAGTPAGDPIAVTGGGSSELRFSRSGRLLAVATERALRVLDLTTRADVATVAPANVQGPEPRLLAFSADDARVLMTHHERTYWWDLAANREAVLQSERFAVAASADGRCLIGYPRTPGREPGLEAVDAMTGRRIGLTAPVAVNAYLAKACDASDTGEVLLLEAYGRLSAYVLPAASPLPPAVAGAPPAVPLAAATARKPRRPPALQMASIRCPVLVNDNGRALSGSTELIAAAGPPDPPGTGSSDGIGVTFAWQSHEYTDHTRSIGQAGDVFAKRYEGFTRQAPPRLSMSRRAAPRNRIEQWAGGAAVVALYVAVADGVELDRAAGILGNVADDWSIAPTLRPRLLVGGLIADGCTTVVVPAQSTVAVTDLMVLQGDKPLWDAQVFSATTVDEALAVVRAKRAPELAKAVALFDELRKERAKSPGVAKTPAGRAKLKQVLDLAPNHLSAECLLKAAEGPGPRLSKAAFFERLLETVLRFSGNGQSFPNAGWRGLNDLKPDEVGRVRQDLAKLKPIAPDAYRPLVDLHDAEAVAYLAYKANFRPGDVGGEVKDAGRARKAAEARARVEAAADALVRERARLGLDTDSGYVRHAEGY